MIPPEISHITAIHSLYSIELNIKNILISNNHSKLMKCTKFNSVPYSIKIIDKISMGHNRSELKLLYDEIKVLQ